MPAGNEFRHQTYCAERPLAPYELHGPPSPSPVRSAAFQNGFEEVAAQFHSAKIAAIYLVHGTFAGNDSLGLFRTASGVMPDMADAMRKLGKRAIDATVNETGNYTERYAAEFEQALNVNRQSIIPVRLFCWSGENHHIGRAEGAVQLVDELLSRKYPSGSRILLWGHSHAGNVFALVTNLLGARQEVRERFFRAARSCYKWSKAGTVDMSEWWRVQEALGGRHGDPFKGVTLDFVTFGTPLRYGWETSAYGNLLHFVNHHPSQGVAEYQAAFPFRMEDMLAASGGDYVQQLGIAGTNFQPPAIAWRVWLANRRLSRVLQGDLRKRDLIGRLKLGCRVANEGTTLLVDYGPGHGYLRDHLAGHAVYTNMDWLLFHAQETGRRFY